MSDHTTPDPFHGMYVPEDGPAAPPAPVGGMPVSPVTGGMPVAPVSAAGGMPVQPVSAGFGTTVAQPAPVPQAAPAPVPVPASAPIPTPVPVPATSPSVTASVPQPHHGGAALPAAASAPGVTTVEDTEQQIALDSLLNVMVEKGGSDLHLSVGSPPVMRIRGEVCAVDGYEPLTPKQSQDTMYSILTSKQKSKFEEDLELDFSYTVPGKARFRVNMLKQRGAVGAVMRTIPWEILSLEALGLPEQINQFANLPRGLVLVTGPTGSGKSTTLAAIIDKINRTRHGHIMTIEDPVEFLHQHRGCVVNQREVGVDTHSFKSALKHVLRQDPDVILVGELRDLETISVALTAAETGHLVFATLHTQSAQETITRIIDVFPPEQQAQVQTQLAASLQGVVCQSLAKTADGKGRQAIVEVMVATSGIRSLIREKKLQQIQGALQSGGKDGMQTLNQDLAKHVLSGRITFDSGLELCSDRDDFLGIVGGEEQGRAANARAISGAQQQQNPGFFGGYPPAQ